jgi:dihydrofolate reductase
MVTRCIESSSEGAQRQARQQARSLGHEKVDAHAHAAPFDWPDATLEKGDAVDVVAWLKEASAVPLRSHGSLSFNRRLMAAGLVDRVQLTIFPVISGRTGAEPVFDGAADFDLELLTSRTLDGRTQELPYRPTPHGSA